MSTYARPRCKTPLLFSNLRYFQIIINKVIINPDPQHWPSKHWGSGHFRPASETPFPWWADGGPRFSSDPTVLAHTEYIGTQTLYLDKIVCQKVKKLKLKDTICDLLVLFNIKYFLT